MSATYMVCHDQRKCGCGNNWNILPFKSKEAAESFRKSSTCVTEPAEKLTKGDAK